MPRWKTAVILFTAGLAIPIFRLHKIIPVLIGVGVRLGSLGLIILAAVKAFSPAPTSSHHQRPF
ncbi:MAG: hypothetical protein K9N36_09840 [Candidatus Marinimicrobia bacterium]|nr:hypothetical protein [Candidatus Neomarinimicrobiota bacterium]